MTENEFSISVKTHAKSLISHALKFTKDLDDANDLVQDTLVKATRFAYRCDYQTNTKVWLFVIMRNTFINNYHKNVRHRSRVVREDEVSAGQMTYSAAANGAETSFAMDDIKKALNSLPQIYSVPFIRYFEGYKYQEIADELNLPLGTVKTYIHHARLRLKKLLKQYNHN